MAKAVKMKRGDRRVLLMCMIKKKKFLFVFGMIIVLLTYSTTSDISADNIKHIDKAEFKIDKKEGKTETLFFRGITFFVLPFVFGEYVIVYSSFGFSYIYHKLARPPPGL